MISGVLIISVSLVLFLYWFRYSCLLLLRNTAERTAGRPVRDERFNVARVICELQANGALDKLERELERDYSILVYLIEHAADLELASVENRLLILDYRLMRTWSHLTRTLAPVQSRRALTEMASVLSVLVQKMGEPANPQEA
jgi:hypothetical protein